MQIIRIQETITRLKIVYDDPTSGTMYEFRSGEAISIPRIGEFIIDKNDVSWIVSDIAHGYIVVSVDVGGRQVTALHHSIAIGTKRERS